MEREEDLKDRKKVIKKSEINREDGLKILYDKEELKKYFPNLTSEIIQGKKKIPINAVRVKKDSIEKEKTDPFKDYKEDLKNPGVFDFIRRCSTLNDALDILDYLLKRNEISKDLYTMLKSIISQDGGLSNLVNKIGGYKEPGYYQKKYYKKYLTKNDLDNNNLD